MEEEFLVLVGLPYKSSPNPARGMKIHCCVVRHHTVLESLCFSSEGIECYSTRHTICEAQKLIRISYSCSLFPSQDWIPEDNPNTSANTARVCHLEQRNSLQFQLLRIFENINPLTKKYNVPNCSTFTCFFLNQFFQLTCLKLFKNQMNKFLDNGSYLSCLQKRRFHKNKSTMWPQFS